MKTLCCRSSFLAFLLAFFLSFPLQASPQLDAYCSPHGGCTEAIGKAKNSILVEAYSFTSFPIAKALIKAHSQIPAA